jgi:predicted MFS family arabinose efflux permease
MAFSGAGAIAGSLAVAWLGSYRRMGLGALVVTIVFGTLVAAFAVSRTLWLSYALLFCTGAGLMVVASTLISLVQLTVPNEMRGRVMSIYLMAFRGGMPLGALASGALASATSAPIALGVGGGLLALAGLGFLLRSPLRHR